MAQYRGTIQGTRGAVSRLGHKTSGLHATVNGWNSGVKVCASYDAKFDRDVFEIYLTTGSNARGGMQKIGEVKKSCAHGVAFFDMGGKETVAIS
jgi:hypothetical protein